jgi:hypothetical protein
MNNLKLILKLAAWIGSSFSISIIFSTGIAVAGPTPQQAHQAQQKTVDFQKIAESLNSTMLQCPERIWPNYNWRSMNVLMATDGQTPVLWQGQSGKLSPLSPKQIPAGAFDGLYSFPKFAGGDAVALYLSAHDLERFVTNSTLQAFQTIVHEGFHLVGQRGWSFNAATQRGTAYPVTSAARLYRRMMFDRMKEYFLSGGKNIASLGKATFWYNKWKAEFHDEYINSMDRLEGIARYIEFMATAIAQGGCGVSDSNIYAALVNTVSTNMGYSVSGSAFQLDTEGYDLGGLAAFILRLIGSDTNWHARIIKGESPLDLVFERVLAIEDTIPENLKTQFQEFAMNQNKESSRWLDTDIAYLISRNSIRIVPSDNSFQTGSFSPKGFFLLSTMKGVAAMPLAQGVEFHKPSWKLNVAADKVMFGHLSSPCSGHETLIATRESVTIENGRIEVHGNGLDGSMSGTLQTDVNGFKWFCEETKAKGK